MVRAMLCATHDRTSDAETSRRTRVDADWKAAMGVDDEFTGIAPRTFSLMRSRMVVHDADATLFEATLKKAIEKGVLKGKLTAIIDSSPVHGAGALCDTYELIRGFLRQAARAAGDRLGAEAAKATEPFCGAKPDIDWQDPAARKAHLGELVAAGRALLAEVEGIDDPAVAEPAGLLGQVIGDDVEEGEDGQGPDPPGRRPRPHHQPLRSGDAPRPQVGVAAIRRPQARRHQRRGLRAGARRRGPGRQRRRR